MVLFSGNCLASSTIYLIQKTIWSLSGISNTHVFWLLLILGLPGLNSKLIFCVSQRTVPFKEKCHFLWTLQKSTCYSLVIKVLFGFIPIPSNYKLWEEGNKEKRNTILSYHNQLEYFLKVGICMPSAVSQPAVHVISFHSAISVLKLKAQFHNELNSASDTVHVTRNWLHKPEDWICKYWLL